MIYERWFKLSRKEYYADFFITPTITALYAYWTVYYNPPTLISLPIFVSGLFLWTLYEYALHRYWLHHGPKFFKVLHGLHHARQDDYIALHPVGTMLTYLLFYAIFGTQSNLLMLGFSCGYIMYSIIHTLLHYNQKFSTKYFPKLLMHHQLHHRFSRKNFGISTIFWDRFFKTEG